MGWWLFGKRNKTHHRTIPGEYVKGGLEDVGFKSVRILDREYLMVEETAAEEIIDAAWGGVNAGYHGNSAEFPDCDDAARVCVGDVIRECVKRGLKAMLPFGLAGISTGEKRHLMCVISYGQGKVRFYEPQNKKWKRPEEMDANSEFEWAQI